MHTNVREEQSLEKMFLSPANINARSTHLHRDVSYEMKIWAAGRLLDDYESVSMDYTEALDFANNEFDKTFEIPDIGTSNADGRKYPKQFVQGGTHGHRVDDYRTHDAQMVQEVMRSNGNFRRKNAIPLWETITHTRHYDRDEHERGLGSIPELKTLSKGYDMSKIYAPNEFISSDSIMYT